MRSLLCSMIYRNSYLGKELRQGYAENKISIRRKIAFAFFSGLISFALYFVLQTMKESVLSDAVPEIMQPSYFSTVYIYIHMAFLLNTIYFIVYYDPLFFTEIRNNSWYLLVKMHYHPAAMIFFKLLALLYFVFLNFTIGFVSTIFLTVFLKYPFLLAYMPALYFSGITDLIFLYILSVTLSLYVKDLINARWLIAFSAVFIKALEIGLGHYSILSNRVTMQNMRNLFDFTRSIYLLATALMIVLCGIVCIFRAGNLAKYYCLTLHSGDGDLPRDACVGYVDTRTGRITVPGDHKKQTRRSKFINAAVVSILIAFICATLIFNILIILINASTPGNEVAIRGEIPFIFQSDTMAPAIMKNDLSFFQKIDSRYDLKVGQIILFEQENVIYVERITQQNGNNLVVDIDSYPPMSQIGAMQKTVQRQDVHGVYSGRNRWLGVLILFANTIIGRLVFLIFPAVLLFYRRQISEIAKKRGL